MEWSGVFTGVTTELTTALPYVIAAVIPIFGIGLALRYSKRVLRMFS